MHNKLASDLNYSGVRHPLLHHTCNLKVTKKSCISEAPIHRMKSRKPKDPDPNYLTRLQEGRRDPRLPCALSLAACPCQNKNSVFLSTADKHLYFNTRLHHPRCGESSATENKPIHMRSDYAVSLRVCVCLCLHVCVRVRNKPW